jgi:hypothetical protein
MKEYYPMKEFAVISPWSNAEVSPDEWMPIDSAPQDGTEILVYFECATVPIVHIAFWMNDNGDEGWWSYTTGSVSRELLCDYREPTHWMPYIAPKRS